MVLWVWFEWAKKAEVASALAVTLQSERPL